MEFELTQCLGAAPNVGARQQQIGPKSHQSAYAIGLCVAMTSGIVNAVSRSIPTRPRVRQLRRPRVPSNGHPYRNRRIDAQRQPHSRSPSIFLPVRPGYLGQCRSPIRGSPDTPGLGRMSRQRRPWFRSSRKL